MNAVKSDLFSVSKYIFLQVITLSVIHIHSFKARMVKLFTEYRIQSDKYCQQSQVVEYRTEKKLCSSSKEGERIGVKGAVTKSGRG